MPLCGGGESEIVFVWSTCYDLELVILCLYLPRADPIGVSYHSLKPQFCVLFPYLCIRQIRLFCCMYSDHTANNGGRKYIIKHITVD